jgi:hypothetical protein
MNTNHLVVKRVLRVREPDARRLGLDRLDEDKLIVAFARWAQGQIKKWLDYAKGALRYLSWYRTTRNRGCFTSTTGLGRPSGWWT